MQTKYMCDDEKLLFKFHRPKLAEGLASKIARPCVQSMWCVIKLLIWCVLQNWCRVVSCSQTAFSFRKRIVWLRETRCRGDWKQPICRVAGIFEDHKLRCFRGFHCYLPQRLIIHDVIIEIIPRKLSTIWY